MIRVLDACCGSKMFWFDKNNPHTLYHGWRDTIIENDIRDMGNIFLTQQEAKDEVRKRKLIARARKSQKGYKVNANNCEKRFYFGTTFGEIQIKNEQYTEDASELGKWYKREDAKKFFEENKPDIEWYFKIV